MNRNKTAQLLKEWKTFLRENDESTFTAQDVKNKLKVKISIKDNFKEYCEDNSLLKYDNKTGILSGHDMKNRIIIDKKTDKEEEHNFVLVMLDGKEEEKVQFPQCCVKRKSDAK